MNRPLFRALICGLTLMVSPIASANEDRNAQPLTYPAPTYPNAAIRAGLSGNCEVLFDVNKTGAVISPKARCTHKAFCEEAVRAISAVSFAPKQVEGKSVARYGVEYPFQFLLEGVSPNTDFGPLEACETQHQAVS